MKALQPENKWVEKDNASRSGIAVFTAGTASEITRFCIIKELVSDSRSLYADIRLKVNFYLPRKPV